MYSFPSPTHHMHSEPVQRMNCYAESGASPLRASPLGVYLLPSFHAPDVFLYGCFHSYGVNTPSKRLNSCPPMEQLHGGQP